MTLLFRVDLFTIPADVLLLECWLSRLFASTTVFRCGKFSGKDCTAKFDRLPICDFHKTLLVVPSYAKKAVFSRPWSEFARQVSIAVKISPPVVYCSLKCLKRILLAKNMRFWGKYFIKEWMTSSCVIFLAWYNLQIR